MTTVVQTPTTPRPPNWPPCLCARPYSIQCEVRNQNVPITKYVTHSLPPLHRALTLARAPPCMCNVLPVLCFTSVPAQLPAQAFPPHPTRSPHLSQLSRVPGAQPKAFQIQPPPHQALPCRLLGSEFSPQHLSPSPNMFPVLLFPSTLTYTP